MEDGIWGQLPELDPVKEKEGAKELMRRKRKTAEEKGNEHNSETLRGLWARNRTWKTNIIFRCGDEAEGAQPVDVAVGNGGGAPVMADLGRVRGTGALPLAHGVRDLRRRSRGSRKVWVKKMSSKRRGR